MVWKDSNCSSDEMMPSYSDVFWGLHDIFEFAFTRYRANLDNYTFPEDIIVDIRNVTPKDFSDITSVICIALCFTFCRCCLTKLLFKPFGAYFGLDDETQDKFAESMYKFGCYTPMWFFTYWVVCFSGRYRFFQEPSTVWNDFSPGVDVPWDIYWIYMVELGFYVQGVYSVLFLDAWRKDSVVMLIHHIVTVLLIWCSYVLRYHNIGVLVLLLHDVCDIQLEFGKMNVYLKVRNGRTYIIHEYIAGGMLLSLLFSWFTSRLYYFPKKALAAVSLSLVARQFYPEYIIFMVGLLCLLLIMNTYWFALMLALVYRIAMGNELEDIREEPVSRSSAKMSGSVTNGNGVNHLFKPLNGNGLKNGDINGHDIGSRNGFVTNGVSNGVAAATKCKDD